MAEVTRHFTATTFIVHRDKVLLHMHKKHGKWLPVGGHIDRDELPHEAAIREVKEEAGFDVKLHQTKDLRKYAEVEELLPPVHLLLEPINEFHQHIDFIYFGTVDSFEISPEAEDFDRLRWFTAGELDGMKEMPEDTSVLAKEALEQLGSST